MILDDIKHRWARDNGFICVDCHEHRAEPVCFACGADCKPWNGCSCDFCIGKKKHEDNWCARCANVRMDPSKHWENLDVCDACDEAMRNGEVVP